ncbi:MAG TPA: hypothetical protein VLU41_18385, partial [Ideonella sp.]|nr:hypothetical protein [Ideonella sp.]
PAVRRRPEARVKAPAAPARTGGPRLQLEPAQALARPAPAASSALAAAPAAAAAPASAITVATAASIPAALASAAAIAPIDNERLRQLEDSLTRLKADNAATRNDLAALQSRLREAEGGRYANPLVYLLAGLVALLLLVLAGVLAWARRRERERAEWWDHAAPSAAPSLHDNGEQSLPAVARSRPADPPVAESAAAQGWRHTVEIPELDAAEAPRRAVSAEELIDLEQQAEFFVTLGQDDAAVELLLNHIASVGGISPLPYLKLLEIHRHRGDREAYERVREQFNQRFNAYAPAWDDRDAPARSLEDDREVMARLQAAWPTPTRAMGVLEPLLFRQGASDAVFDLAAYREVLFLYEIARDLADRESRPPSVDLELPIGDAPSVVSYPLHTTMPITPAAGVARPLALDVNLDDAPEGAEQPNERSQRYEGGDFSFSSPAPLPGARGKPRPR